MQFSVDFYRRRLRGALSTGHGGHGRDAGPLPTPVVTEAALFAVATDTDFVREAYRFYLKRDPDLGGLVFFSRILDEHGRQAVADGLRNSAEGLAAAPLAAPEPALATRPEPAGPIELADLAELAGDRAFVVAAYDRTLGRVPDPDGLEHHLQRLRQGEPRDMIVHSLAASPEAAERGRRFTWRGRPWQGPSRAARVRAAMRRAMTRAAS